MLGQREVIIIGLGKFGKTVSNNLAHMIEERRIQLGKIANSVIPHYIDFEGDEVFHSTDYENKILESIECSQAYKNGEEFSVIFTGDLYENSTAKYAVDFAYLPHLLQQVTAFKFNEVIGFFTFVDQLGVVESTSEETFALICKHFNRLEKINSKNLYEVPFNTLLNKKLKDIPSPAGPFNRNYVLLTPGKSKSVTDETAVIFAERIFYELFYLSEKLREQSHNWISEVNDKRNSDKNLSCFSMVQIPRINEIQKYYLKYLFEEKIVSTFLQDPLKGTDEEYFRAKFFDMIEVPAKSDEFPIERASQLFINRYRENFSRILNFYISGKNRDFTAYITECKKRIEDTVFDMLPRYDDFAQEETDYFFITLKKGFENLFKIDRINGNFKTYISFVTDLKVKLEKWESSLKRISEGMEIYDIENDFENANREIERLQKKKILSFFPIRPIRQKLIENAILSLPVEKYLDSLIRQNLAKSLYEYWKSISEKGKSPVDECNKILTNLNNILERFEDKEKYLLEKIQFIENMNNSYYILPIFEVKDDYAKLLERIKNRNFGAHNLKNIKDVTSNAIKLYVSGKDIFDITQNPSEFINFIENDFINENKHLFSEIEEKIEEFYNFSKQAVQETKTKTENINAISFETVGTSLFQNETMLVPKNIKPDYLTEEIDAKFDGSLEKLEIPKDFTLGSVVYFKDYLYMSQKSLKKKDFLETFRNTESALPEYDNSLTEKIIISDEVKNDEFESPSTMQRDETCNPPHESTEENNTGDTWKYTRAILMFYVDSKKVIEIYNRTFDSSKELLDDEEIEKLAKEISLEDSIHEMSDDRLFEFAKDNDVRICEDRIKQENLILRKLLGR